jgi:hypothetical protein
MAAVLKTAGRKPRGFESHPLRQPWPTDRPSRDADLGRRPTMTDPRIADDERALLEQELGADLPLPEEQPDADDVAAAPDPASGDPPDTIRGEAQSLVDPVGESADDDTPRWDPRTATASSREGG